MLTSGLTKQVRLKTTQGASSGALQEKLLAKLKLVRHTLYPTLNEMKGSMNRSVFSGLGLVLALLVCAGCGTSAAATDPALQAKLAEQRSRILLTEEPQEVLGVLDLRDAMEQGPVDEITVVGQIGGAADPWTAGKASFMIADPSMLVFDEDGNECEEDCGCPHCKKNHDPTLGKALVQLVDESGNILPYDAKSLLAVEKNQLVVVRGQAKWHDLGYPVVSARALYIRK